MEFTLSKHETNNLYLMYFFMMALSVQSQTLSLAKQIGGASDDASFSIAIDAAGNQYITGYFSGTTDFDPGPGTYNITSTAYHDSYLSKINSSGNFVWAKAFGGCNEGTGNSLATDASGNVYITGHFTYIADFDPGPSTTNLNAAGSTDVYINKISPSGDFVWAKQLGGPYADYCYSIAVDASGNIYGTGHFNGFADFDPGPGTSYFNSVGAADIFVYKLSQTVTVLPLKWLSFTIEKQGNNTLLIWSAANQQNTKDFIIQHSSDGAVWNNIGLIAAAGNSNTVKDYRYVHTSPLNGINYYRILQTDIAGRSSFSNLKSIKFSTESLPFVVLKNPGTNGIIQVQVNKPITLSLYDYDSNLLWQKKVSAGTEPINVSGFAKGVYLLKTNAQSEKVLV